ncbi:MAG TPA: hypothetical protein VD704_06340 [Gaiellaceae bacterium]|nr:hypothetical protein [Gaiellaceae bacterium]
MWGEGASDLWGRLEEEEAGRELDLTAAIRERLRAAAAVLQRDEEADVPRPSGRQAA